MFFMFLYGWQRPSFDGSLLLLTSLFFGNHSQLLSIAQNVSCLSSLMVLTVEERVTVVAIAAVAVAGMVAVSASVVIVVEMTETGSSQGHR